MYSHMVSNYERTLRTVINLISELNWSSLGTDAELPHCVYEFRNEKITSHKSHQHFNPPAHVWLKSSGKADVRQAQRLLHLVYMCLVSCMSMICLAFLAFLSKFFVGSNVNGCFIDSQYANEAREQPP